MSIGKASDFRVHDQSAADNIAKRPADSSYITLSDDTIADDASIGDILGTLSITAAYVGTPRWEIIGQSNFAVNATTGVVTVAHALTAGSDSFKVKLRGTTPQINSPTFAITVDSGGGGGYVAKAVVFEDGIFFTSNSLITADSPYGLFSMFFYMDNSNPSNDVGIIWQTLAGGFWAINIERVSGSVSCDFWDTTNSVHFQFSFQFGIDPAIPFTDGWHSVQIAVNTNHLAGQKIGQIVIDGVARVVTIVSDTAPAFDIGWSQDATSTVLQHEEYETTLAEVYAGLGQLLDLSNPANIEKFLVGGKPVSLGADGSLPTGVAPTVWASGDKDTFLQPNLGTGGAFTLTGALTNATTSPSD